MPAIYTRIALPVPKVFIEIAVLVPSEPDNYEIEHGEENKENGVRKQVAINLIHNKKRKDDDGGGIRPELVTQKSRDQDYLDDAVAHEIE